MKGNYKMRLKKITAACFIALGMMLSMTACGNKNNTENNASPAPTGVVATDNANADAETSAFPITLTDATGTDITITQEPQRIVSLSPNATEIICALGLEDKLVGRTSYCNYPEGVADITDIGSSMDMNVEAIANLNPDLAVASVYIDENVLNQLRGMNIPVVFLDEEESFSGTYATIVKIGRLTGTNDQANEILRSMQERVGELRGKIEQAKQGKEDVVVYYTNQVGDSDFGAGGDTFIGEIIELAGGVNMAKDVSGWAISKELITEKDPDVIFVPSNRDMITQMQNNDFYKNLTAVKEGKVYEVDEDIISRQGPRVVEGISEMAVKINPDLKLD